MTPAACRAMRALRHFTWGYAGSIERAADLLKCGRAEILRAVGVFRPVDSDYLEYLAHRLACFESSEASR